MSAIDKIRQLNSVAMTLEDIARVGAHAYANGYQGHPAIVKQHYTPGNAGRQGWPPLSQAYAARKASGLSRAKKGGGIAAYQKLKTGERVKTDPSVPFSSKTGTVTGYGAGANLPMLVLTGKLRAAVGSGSHQVTSSGDTATVRFSGLPDYADYLQEGSARMPKRSPVDVSPDDRKQVVEVMVRVVKGRITGQGGNVPVTTQPGSTPRIV